ncbi:uncharacterized protein LOC117328237 [Pecten maximus]|uniref:uncharacterized protein LOC117328237 n=1 Tax=Pecten maximus TaxID=6579 RepID=UPI00145822B3|nr:uncharacterized protein LOC117328237 [Pecten maximus]
MAHCDGRSDQEEYSMLQQQNGNRTEQGERRDNPSETHQSDNSWTVLNSDDTSAEYQRTCYICSNEDYPSAGCSCLLTNITPGYSSQGHEALSLPGVSGSSDTHLKELAECSVQENDNSLDQGRVVLAPSNLASSFGSASLSTNPDYDCENCSLIDSALPSQDSIDFWRSVPRKGLDENGCHIKFLEKFIKALKDFSNAHDLLADSKVLNLFKTLLKVDMADETAVVEYKNFARLVKYLGPVKRNEGVLLQQIHSIKAASIVRDKSRREKMSWFAGEMSRKDAESILKNERCGTYLVRMSQTTVGAFVVSVQYEGTVEHVEISGDYREAVANHPYDARLSLNGNMYTSLVEAVTSLKTQPLTITEEADEGEEGEEAEKSFEVFCKFCCPSLPLNGVISGYKKARR